MPRYHLTKSLCGEPKKKNCTEAHTEATKNPTSKCKDKSKEIRLHFHLKKSCCQLNPHSSLLMLTGPSINCEAVHFQSITRTGSSLLAVADGEHKEDGSARKSLPNQGQGEHGRVVPVKAKLRSIANKFNLMTGISLRGEKSHYKHTEALHNSWLHNAARPTSSIKG